MSQLLSILQEIDSLDESSKDVLRHYLSQRKGSMVLSSKVVQAAQSDLPIRNARAAALEREADAIPLPADFGKPGKRGRRQGQVDTNSARQRIFRAIREFLTENPDTPGPEVWERVAKKTGFSYDKVRANAFQCPGINRHENWNLAA